MGPGGRRRALAGPPQTLELYRMSRKQICLLALGTLLVGPLVAAAQEPAVAVPVEGAIELATDEQKTLYALGMALSQNLTRLNLQASELAYVVAGLEEGVLASTPRVPLDQYLPKLQSFAQERFAAAAAREQEAAETFVARQAAEAGAVKTPSGLVYFLVTEGSGTSPAATDVVKVHYRGTLPNGTVFDSSRERGQPVSFPLDQVIPCWTEAVQMMKVGGQARIVCPPGLAYGAEGRPGIPPNAPLVFEVELLGIEPPAPPAEPAATPPAEPQPTPEPGAGGGSGRG
jgi:FKBP-type peptidyl-prolyl cis-trans isomerase